MFSALKKWSRITRSRRGLLLEAVWNSCLAWGMIRVLPYSFWRKWLGAPITLDKVPQDIAGWRFSNDPMIKDIGWVHDAIERRTKFFTCLMLGFSAKNMLRRRGYPSIIVLGVGQNDDTVRNHQRLGAHAWVIHNGLDIAGGTVKSKFSPVAAFGESAAI